MKLVSKDIDYEVSNGVELQKNYRISFPNGSVFYGRVVEVEFVGYSSFSPLSSDKKFDYILPQITSSGIVQESAINKLTLETEEDSFITIHTKGVKGMKFEEKLGFETYSVEYDEIEDIIKKHYKRKGMSVHSISFDEHDISIIFEG